MGAASAGSALAFIDTNIWLYAFSTSQEKLKSQRAKGIIRGTPQIALSTQVVNEVSVNMLRKFQADEQAIRKSLPLSQVSDCRVEPLHLAARIGSSQRLPRFLLG
jgi:predicted nucleic acid-binding protein